MANSLSAEVWLDERRWDALEKALKARGTDIEQHLQDYLMKLYSETVPFDQWVQIESTITKEELETAQAVEEEKVYAVFHVREHGQDRLFASTGGEEFLDVAIRLRRYVRGGDTTVCGGFMGCFYKAKPITRERFDELTALRMENTGKVSGAFEIDLDAGWISGLRIMDGWQTFKIKDVSAAVYYATRGSRVSLKDQWEKFINHLDGKQIGPESFAPAEIGGLRPLEAGDVLCIDGPFPVGRELKFRLDLSSYGVQKEVLNLMVDCSKPENSLDITCGYDAARQGIGDTLDLTLREQGGVIRHDFFYPLVEEKRIVLLKMMEQFCQQHTGKTLNDYYAQVDLERNGEIPTLTGGSQKLPLDAVSFADEITEHNGKLSFYIPVNFNPDAVFGTNVTSTSNDDWLNIYASFDWKTGHLDNKLAVYLVCSDGHEFAFSYPLTPVEQALMLDKMDAYCRQQNGQSLEETRASLLREQLKEGLEIQL